MIYHDMPMLDYMKLRGFSNSVAWRVISQSPHHARYSQTAASKHSDTAAIGTIADMLLLEGNEDGLTLIDADSWRKADTKAQRDAAYAEGKTPLLKKDIEPIREMVSSARRFVENSEIKGVFDSGHAQVTLDWDDGGLRCKIRPDYLTDKWHISLKTTDASAKPDSWIRRQLSPMGYGFGVSFYERGLLANNIDVQHRLLVIEQNPPFACSLVAIAPSKKAIEDARVERAIAIWRKCKELGKYPSYSTQTHYAEASPWELADHEEQENDDSAFFTDKELEGGIPL
jgi:hypothetical protein